MISKGIKVLRNKLIFFLKNLRFIKKRFFLILIFLFIILPISIKNISLIKFSSYKAKTKIFLKESYYSNCNIKEINHIPSSSTIIAGHIYKNNNKDIDYLNNKLISFLSENINKIDKIIFSGDIFEKPSKSKWQKLYEQFGVKKRIFISPGNHDIGLKNDDLYFLFKSSKLFFKEFPYKISGSGYEIIIEDSISNRWLISQKTKDLINSNSLGKPLILVRHNIPVKNFLFLANSHFGKSEKLPNLKTLNKIFDKEIIIISGDGGNANYLPRFFCSKREKITYIINGLGGLKKDSLIILHNKTLYKYKL
tara:strand:+ start:810 stop:1733 length:924 start_codon:yes stop_codon:yes gene_type:complete